jgi:hypothetical protein
MSYSMSRQDLFVLHMMNGKVGHYLEIGASHPVDINNTYLLEQNGWWGLSVDIDSINQTQWKATRKNELMITDALKLNFIDAERIDYLQLDIDPPEQTMQCLLNMLATGCRFSIITFEHDAYTGSNVRQISRQVLEAAGYMLAVPDVQSPFGPYEDWWLDPSSDLDIERLKTWK